MNGSGGGAEARRRAVLRRCFAFLAITTVIAAAFLLVGRSRAQSAAQQASLLGQSQSDVDRKSAGCVSCLRSFADP